MGRYPALESGSGLQIPCVGNRGDRPFSAPTARVSNVLELDCQYLSMLCPGAAGMPPRVLRVVSICHRPLPH